jgi:hypothetical protein
LEALPSPVSKSLHPVTSTPRKVDSDIITEDQSLPYAGIDHQPSLFKQTYEPDLPLLKSKHFSVLKLPENQFMSLQTNSDSDDSPVRIIDFQTPEKPVIISSDSSDEQITIAQESGTIKYHDGNQKVAIFSAPKGTLSTKEIFKLCFGEVDERHICAEKPISVRKNAVFVINLNDIDIRSLYADDNGVWNVVTPRKYFRVEIKYGKIAEVLPGHKDNYTHLLKRQYGKHQATYSERGVTFQRIISTVFSKSGHRCRNAVLQYIHRDGSEDDVVMLSHSNTKKTTKRQFMKTDPSVIESIKEEPLETKPRKMFKTMMDEVGGPLYSSAAAS